MNFLSSLYRRSARGRKGVVLALALFVLPYLVDVAYYGDFTPTHFAQENAIEEDILSLDDKGASHVGDQQDNVVASEIVIPVEPCTCMQDRPPAGSPFPRQYLISASLISRPPPAA